MSTHQSFTLDALNTQIKLGYQYLRSDQLAQAKDSAAQLSSYSHYPPVFMFLLEVCWAEYASEHELQSLLKSVTSTPESTDLMLVAADFLQRTGCYGAARSYVQLAMPYRQLQPGRTAALAGICGEMEDYPLAAQFWQEASLAEPDNLYFRHQLVLTLFFLNRIDEAQLLLADLLKLLPSNGSLLHLRSTLKKATTEQNHLNELKLQLQTIKQSVKDRIAVCFALAKEAEDLGLWRDSFSYLAEGAALKRSTLNYKVQNELDSFQAIAKSYDAQVCQSVSGIKDASAIFVLGMPRTGTTLVERMLNSHAKVTSLGEFQYFPKQLVETVIHTTAPATQAGHTLIERSVGADFNRLGAAYMKAAREKGAGAEVYVDKLPFNFMYCGMITKALPQAKIVHLLRDPMDTCYAIFKTLFHQVYSFSYQLDELASYYIGYHNLMLHWQSVLPGKILLVRYEQLVQHTESEARRLLEFCGLDWQDEVLEFHLQEGASSTASAAQIRQPVHKDSLNKWRQFATELEPLRKKLQQAGIVDADGQPVSALFVS